MVEQSDGEIASVENEPWRSTAIPLRVEYVEWAYRQHEGRQNEGISKYGAVEFKGDPLDQGIEENLDQLFYLYWAKRKLAFVEGQRNTFRHLLESVIEFGLSEMVYTQITEALNAKPG